MEVCPASNLSTCLHGDKWWKRGGENQLSFELVVSSKGWGGRMQIHLKQAFYVAKIFGVLLFLVTFGVLIGKA